MKQKLDLLVELGGEDSKTKSRSHKAIEIYRDHGRLPIVISGSHSGIIGPELPPGTDTEYNEVSRFLLSEGVRDEDLEVEKEALDTLGNFYFLRRGGFVPEGSEVGLITDTFHMPRSLFSARKVFGESANFIPITANTKINFNDKAMERFYRFLTALDLRGIKNGDFEAIEHFMKNKHPYYSQDYWKNQEFSWQGAAINILRKMDKKKISYFTRSIRPTLDKES